MTIKRSIPGTPLLFNSISSRIVVIVISIFFLSSVSLTYYLYNMQRDYIRLSYGKLSDSITKLIYNSIASNKFKKKGELNEFLLNVGKTTPSLTILIFNSELKVIASTDKGYLGKTAMELKTSIEDEILDEVVQVLTQFRQIKKTYFRRGDFETVVPFESKQLGRGVIYTLINFDYLMGSFISSLIKQVFTLSAIFVLCTIAILLLIRRLVITPMEAFLKGFNEVTKGNYKKMDFEQNISEFRGMAEAFNNMLNALKSREELIRVQNEQLSTLYWVNETFLTEKSLDRALEKILLLMTALGGIKKRGVIFLETQGILEPVAAVGFEKEVISENCLQEMSQCYCTRAFNEGVTVFLDSQSKEHLHCMESEHHYHLVFPIMTARRKYGLVCLYIYQEPSEDLKILLNHIGEETAVAIERFKLIEELNETSRKLASLNEEMRALLNAVSHDLRNPLVSIEGYSDMLLEDLNETLGDDQREYISGIKRNVQYLSEIANALLKLSRIERREPKIEDIDIKGFMDELCLDVVTRQGDVDIRVLGQELKIRSDRTLLWQVFSNLINNSIKYSKPGESAIIEIDWIKKGDRILFTVKDNGVGIDRELISTVFLPFTRATSVSEGTGLGLSIVKKSVELLGGRVWIDSIKGQGTIVYVELPQ